MEALDEERVAKRFRCLLTRVNAVVIMNRHVILGVQ